MVVEGHRRDLGGILREGYIERLGVVCTPNSAATYEISEENSPSGSSPDTIMNDSGGSPRRENSPAPRLITDLSAPPEVHRIVIEFNEKPVTTDSTAAAGADTTSSSNKKKPTLRRQPSSNLAGYLRAQGATTSKSPTRLNFSTDVVMAPKNFESE